MRRDAYYQLRAVRLVPLLAKPQLSFLQGSRAEHVRAGCVRGMHLRQPFSDAGSLMVVNASGVQCILHAPKIGKVAGLQREGVHLHPVVGVTIAFRTRGRHISYHTERILIARCVCNNDPVLYRIGIRKYKLGTLMSSVRIFGLAKTAGEIVRTRRSDTHAVELN